MPTSPHDHEPPNWLKAKVANVVWRITPACREVARLTSEERDHPLPLGMRVKLRLHRSFCTWCERYAQQLDLIHEASHRFPEHAGQLDESTLGSDAKARMKRALQNQANVES